MYIKLIILFAFLLALFFYVRSNKFMLANKNKLIAIKEAVSLGTKEKILLLNVNNREILLGITSQSIRTLAVWDKDNKNTVCIESEIDNKHKL